MVRVSAPASRRQVCTLLIAVLETNNDNWSDIIQISMLYDSEKKE